MLVIGALWLGLAAEAQAQSTCSSGTAVPDPTNNAGLVADCTTLLSARDTLDGSTSTGGDNLNWSVDLAMSSWERVTISGTPSRVTRLSLGSRRLSGSIPSELGDLTSLERLDLRWNELSGTIPSELGDLSSLEQLDLRGNELSGTIPSELGDLSSLRVLYLSRNELSGTIPSELGNLSSLEQLDLYHNELSGTIPSELGELSSLEWLFLGGSELSGSIPSWLGDLTSLERLSLSFTDLSGTIPSELGELSSLEGLALYGNDLSGTIPSWLGDLSSLEYLALGDNDLSGTIPSELGDLTSLKYLALDNNELSGSIPSWLGDLTSLEELHLDNNELSGSIPSELGDLSRLERLHLDNNELSGTIPSELGELSRLFWLDLGSNELSGTIPSELGDLSSLHWLYLDNNELSGTIPSELGDLTHLRYLYLNGNQLNGCVPTSLSTQLTTTDVGAGDPPELKFCEDGPGKPQAPTVGAVGLTSVRVSWSEPVNEGAAISDFDVQYREGSSGDFTSYSFTSTGSTTSTEISGLLRGRSYEAQVRATSADGSSPWSESGAGQTDAVSVSFGAGTYSASEGGTTATAKVILDVAAVEAVTIPITVAAGSDTEESDYAVSGLTNDALSFAVGDTSQRITITANEDADSADESVELGFGTLPTGVAVGTVTTATVALADNDPLTVTLSGPQGTVYTVFEVTITFSEEVSGFEASEVTVGGGEATLDGSGAEYTATITPSAAGTVTVDVAAGVAQAQDGSGNNEAATQIGVSVQLCTTGSAVADPATDTGLVDDCTALLSARDTLDGSTSTGGDNLNWSVDLAMSSWDGVTISGTPSRVTKLSLDNTGLSGTIPGELGDLTSLTELWLRSNDLSGTIPSELGDLTSLQVLDLRFNDLSGTIPSELGDLSSLQSLSLTSNDLSGTIPSELGDLSSLRYLYLNSNDLSGTIPSELGGLSSLWYLSLSSNDLSGTIPSELGDLSSLEALDLGDNELSGTIPSELGDLSSLEALDLGDNELSGTIPSELGDLSSLEALDLGDNELGGSIPSELGGLTQLTTLYLNGNQLSGCVPTTLSTQLTTTDVGAGTPPELKYCDEGPGKPEAPTVSATGLTSVSVSWSEPVNEGAAISDFDVQYREGSSGDFTSHSFTSTGSTTSTEISGLLRGRSYEAQVRATSADGSSPWSESGAGLTDAVSVSFGAGTYIASEGGTTATAKVSLDVAAVEAVTIPITVEAGSDTEASDYAVSGLTINDELSFEVGDTSQTITITANEDADSADESVELGFGTLPTGVAVGTVTTATVALADDERVTVLLNGPQDTVDNVFDVTITFSEEVSGFAASEVTVGGGTATLSGSGTEYTATITPSESGTVTVDVAAGVAQAQDGGRDNDVATQFSVLVQFTCSTGRAVADPATDGDLVDDCNALLAARDTLDGSTSTGGANLNWSADLAMSSWDGVTISGTPSRVTTLNLYNKGLSGTIPGELGDLTSLRELWLRSNDLSGTIPSELGDLSSLQALSLSSNDLSGTIPSELGDLSGLEELYLSSNELSGTIPSELGDLADLEELYLRYNELSGTIPSELGGLTNLDELYLNGNQLSGCVATSLRAHLTGTDVGAGTPPELKFCDEGPGKPEAPTVGAAGLTSVSVSWSEPVNEGAAISDFDVQYREGSSGSFTNHSFTSTGSTTSTEISGLLPGRSYEAQVKATSADGSSPWSESGAGLTGAVLVSFGAGTYSASEGGTTATAKVILNVAAVEAVTIPITVEAGSDTEASDYAVTGLTTNAELSFEVGDTSQTITITANEDTDSADESVELGFGTLPTGVAVGTVTTATVALADDELMTTVVLNGPQDTVDNAFDVTITFSEEVSGFETSEVTVGGGTATLSGSGAEYTARITPSESGTVTVDVADGVAQAQDGSGDNKKATQISVLVQFTCSTIGSAVADPATDWGLVDDCNALLAGRDELDGSTSTGWGNLNWSADLAMSSWRGLTISGTPSRVTRLSLSQRGLSGTIPSELGDLTSLEELVLYGNDLSGTIPSELGNLSSLERLDLSWNDLSGTIPSELGDLTSLEELFLYNNELSGSIPSELGNLSSLWWLDLSHNELSGSIPSELGDLSSLEQLVLYGNELSGSIPSWLGDLSNLSHLRLDSNELSGSIPSWLGDLSSLRVLTLGWNDLSGSIPSELGDLSRLEQLVLAGNDLSGAIPSELGDLPVLLGLYLRDNDLSGAIPRELGELSNLVLFDLSNNDLSGAIPSELGELSSRLNVLHLSNNDLSGSIPSELGDLSNLWNLHLDNNDLSGTIPSELGDMSSLGSLMLGGNELSGSIPSELGDLPYLGSLMLGGNELSGSIPSELGDLPYLSFLDLSSNDLSGTIPSELGDLTYLVELYLNGNQLNGCVATSLEAQLTGTDVGEGDPPEFNYCDEGPGKPEAPMVGAVGPTRVSVSWNEPVNEGAAISDFDVQYRQGTSGSFTNHSFTSTGSTTSTEISGLLPGRSYEAQVKATSADGSSPWSESGAGLTEAVLVSFGAGEYSASEGGTTATAKVILNVAAVEAVTIPITVEAGSDTEASDYAVTGLTTNDELSFEVGDTSQTITITANEDADSADESVELGFGELPTGVAVGTVTTATVALADDDLLVVLSGPQDTVYTVFEVTITFSEEVSGFEASEVTVGGAGEATLDGSGAEYTATITPSASGTVTVDVAAGVAQAQDGGWDNEAATQISVSVQLCTTGSAVADPATDTGLVDDCIALLSARDMLDGSTSTGGDNLNWSVDLAMSSWDGVTISGTPSRVTKLNLDNTGLSGTIPSELGNLSSLEQLDLNYNDLSGTIPSELGDLSSLESLDLADNDLSGTIPSELGELSSLEYLDLGWNDLSGTIPSELGDLSSLQALFLFYNELSGTIPSELGDLSKLRYLKLSNNDLSGSIPSELGGLSDLRFLGLSNNDLSGTIPSELGDLSDLESLYLRYNELSGTIPSELGDLTNLDQLYLNGNQLSGCVATSLRARLTGTDVGAGTPPELKFCDEGPGKPEAPTVGAAGTTSVSVSWSEPVNEGAAISDFDVQYREGSSGSFTNHSFTSTGSTTSTTISGLLPGRSYEAQVKATSADGSSPWSESGAGQTEAVLVSFGAGTYSASEGGTTATAKVILNVAAVEAVTIPITVAAGSDTEENDYAVTGLTNAELSFEVGDTSQRITITANEDTDSADESVELGFGTLPTGVAVGTVTTATVTLADDERVTVVLNGPQDTVDTVFEVRITFSEEVSGFEASEVTVGGGEATLDGSGAEYTATITPSAAGTVTVDVAAGVAQAQDGGRDNEAAMQISVSVELCTTGSAVADPATDTGLVDDCTALLSARDTLDGSTSTGGDNLNWSVDLAMSSWDGVTISGTPSRVTKLSLYNRGLSGSIPSELGDLTSLEELNLNRNQLSGSIPSELGDLTSLRWLDLRFNDLSGTIPSELGDLTSLEWLSLAGNDLSGSIPSELGDLTSLERLSLAGNDLSGTIPSELGDLTSLEWLNLAGNDLSGTIPSELGDLTSLEVLNLGYNDLSGTIPSELGNLSNLRSLYLNNNDLSGSIPSELGDLTSLKGLNLNGNQLSGSIPSELGDLTSLTRLWLGNNDLSGSIPSELGETSLVVLYLSNNDLSGSIPSELGDLTSLEALKLSNNDLSGSIPSELGDLTSLRALNLGDNELSGTIPSELGDLTWLEALDLGDNELSGSIPSELGDLTSLRALNLGDNELSGTIPSELGDLTSLTRLYLNGNQLNGCVPTSLEAPLTATDVGAGNPPELKFCDDGPGKPEAPTVSAAATTSVRVSWSEPVNEGAAINDFDVQYREGSSGSFTNHSFTSTGSTTSTTISGLLPGRSYEAQVKATSADGSSPWSESGAGLTDAMVVSFGAGTYSASEGGTTATATVSLDAAAVEAVTIPITVTPVGTAETGDYTVAGLSSGAVTFVIGEQTKELTVTAEQDHDAADEVVELGFGTLPGSATLGTVTTARVSLTDNDTEPLAVKFGAASYTAVEGAAVAVTVAVELNQRALQELSVAITATPRGTTVAGDFEVSAGAVTFAVGDDEKSITITAKQDTDASDEVVVLGFGAGVPAGSTATAEVSLEDDDTEALSASFGAASYTAAEGGTGVSVTVELSQEALAEVTLPITVTRQGTTVAGDYQVSDLTSGAVTFAAGEDEQTITVTAAEDADRADERVVLGIGEGLPAGTTATAVVTLEDNDTEGVSYESAAYRIAEGQALTVTVNLEPAASGALTVPITVTAQGSTTASDYVVSDNALTFATGDDSKSFSISTSQDTDADDEGLALGFGTLPAGVSAGAVSSATVAVIDDESTDARVTFNAASYSASEGSTTATTVTVNLQPAPTAAVTIPITMTPQGTTASGDYEVAGLSNGAVTVAANQLTTTFTVAANEDTDATDEIVELGFGTLPTGTAAGVTATTAVTLSDNDTAALEVSYGAASYSTTEGSTTATVTVNLSQGAQSELGVPITVAPRGTTEAGDYMVGGLNEDGTLTFAAGDTSQTFTVRANDDVDAADEAVVLGFGGVVPAGSQATAVVTLGDDDTAALEVEFDAASYTASVGGTTATVTVKLNQGAIGAVAIPITDTPRGTTQETDYTVGGLSDDGELVFAAGETTQTFTVTATADGDGADEEVVLGFGGVVPVGAQALTVVTLQHAAGSGGNQGQNSNALANDDDRSRVSFDAERYLTEEGGEAVTITVKMSPAAADSVVVPITVSPQAPTVAADYTVDGLNEAGELVFAVGDTSQTFTFMAEEDADGADETVLLGFGKLPAGFAAGSPATATVQIADDERPIVERISRVNKALLPHLAQAATASTLEAITGRIAAARTGAAHGAEFDTSGLERLRDAVAAREQVVPLSRLGEVLPSVEQILGDSAFTLPMDAGLASEGTDEPASGAAATLWGSGDYRNLSGSDGNEDGVTWGGDLFSAHLGVDTPLSRTLLAGVALSWAQGSFDYTDRHDGEAASGRHVSWTLSAHPYVSWTPLEALGLWATVGYGGGQLEIDDEAAADLQTSATTRLVTAAGGRATLSNDRLLPGGTTTLTAKGEASSTWADVEGALLIEPLAVQVWRARLALETAHARALAWGAHITPLLELGVRYDGIAGAGGAGLELGGALRYVEPAWGLTVESRGRVLLIHEGDYREWGVGGRVELDLGSGREGLALSVAPSYGQISSGVERLWAAGTAQLAGGSAPALGRVSAKVSYGLSALGGQILVVPYGGLTLVEAGVHRYQVGSELDLGPAFKLNLAGEHEVRPTGTALPQLRLTGKLSL